MSTTHQRRGILQKRWGLSSFGPFCPLRTFRGPRQCFKGNFEVILKTSWTFAMARDGGLWSGILPTSEFSCVFFKFSFYFDLNFQEKGIRQGILSVE